MIVFAREVFVCKCATAVPAWHDDGAAELVKRMTFKKGEPGDLFSLPREHHDEKHLAELSARLERGEHWMVGEADGQIVTYTWLHTRPTIEYPYLPGCVFQVAGDVGYGYDAWTPPELRKLGLRRKAFVEELTILARAGRAWEASFFVKHQLEGATRSLALAGIEIVPLWRVSLGKGRKLEVEKLASTDESARPAF